MPSEQQRWSIHAVKSGVCRRLRESVKAAVKRPLRPGLGVHERGPDGQLPAARIYDDIEPPAERP